MSASCQRGIGMPCPVVPGGIRWQMGCCSMIYCRFILYGVKPHLWSDSIQGKVRAVAFVGVSHQSLLKLCMACPFELPLVHCNPLPCEAVRKDRKPELFLFLGFSGTFFPLLKLLPIPLLIHSSPRVSTKIISLHQSLLPPSLKLFSPLFSLFTFSLLLASTSLQPYVWPVCDHQCWCNWAKKGVCCTQWWGMQPKSKQEIN